MHEQYKLEESRYFYSRMEETKRNSKHFCYNLNAFLSAARSILQYIYNKVEKTPNQSWYDDKMAKSKLLKFFRDKRDFNIHTKPISPMKEVCACEQLSITETVIIKQDNEIIFQSDNPNELKENAGESEAEVEISYVFEDWDGDETVLELCKRYMQKLEDTIEDGIKKDIIS